MKFGEQLKTVRSSKGLSQSKAAQAIGCPTRTLQQWEQDRCSPAEWCQRLVLQALQTQTANIDLPA
jgi:DNA-binding transcriptional regulator YiaG